MLSFINIIHSSHLACAPAIFRIMVNHCYFQISYKIIRTSFHLFRHAWYSAANKGKSLLFFFTPNIDHFSSSNKSGINLMNQKKTGFNSSLLIHNIKNILFIIRYSPLLSDDCIKRVLYFMIYIMKIDTYFSRFGCNTILYSKAYQSKQQIIDN